MPNKICMLTPGSTFPFSGDLDAELFKAVNDFFLQLAEAENPSKPMHSKCLNQAKGTYLHQ